MIDPNKKKKTLTTEVTKLLKSGHILSTSAHILIQSLVLVFPLTMYQELHGLYLGLLVLAEDLQLLQLCPEPSDLRLALLMLLRQLSELHWKLTTFIKF